MGRHVARYRPDAPAVIMGIVLLFAAIAVVGTVVFDKVVPR